MAVHGFHQIPFPLIHDGPLLRQGRHVGGTPSKVPFPDSIKMFDLTFFRAKG